jgi:RNA polymerase sigma-70 factor (ECF subfamily)
VAEAQDLTQGFFAELLEKNYVAQARQDRGRFRSFLLTALKNFMAKEWRKEHRQKRHPDEPLLTLEMEAGESRYLGEASDGVTPEKLYEQRWAQSVMDRAVERLRREYSERNAENVFESVKECLGSAKLGRSHREVASELGMKEEMISVLVHRMRRRYRELVRFEIAQTVSSEKEVAEELEFLMEALRG